MRVSHFSSAAPLEFTGSMAASVFILSGGDTRYLFKNFAEIIWIFKAQEVRNLIHQIFMGVDQLFRMVDFYGGDIVGDGYTSKLFEGIAQVAGTNI